MKNEITVELTTQEKAAARMLADKVSTALAAKEVGLNERTLRRRMKTPQFVAYQISLTAAEDEKLDKKVQAKLKRIALDKAELVDLLAVIVRTPAIETNKRYGDQVAAGKLIADMMGWIPKAGAVVDASPEAEKPDVYQAEWMRKPQ